MDANGTRYHLLLGEADWLRCRAEEGALRAVNESLLGAAGALALRAASGPRVVWNRERGELTLRPRLFQFAAAPGDFAPEPETRRGAAPDRYGNWYWVDETERQVRVSSAGTRRASNFWPPDAGANACAPAEPAGDFRPRDALGPPAPLSFRGLAVTEDHYLVVGVLDPAGLLFFDLHAGGPPQQIVWPASVPFAPFDMAPAPSGGVLILDREHKRYWALDRRLNVLTEGQQLVTLRAGGRDDFQPRGGGHERLTAPREFPEGVSLADSVPVPAADPVAIEAMPDGTVLILDRNPSEDFCRVFHYRFQTQLGEPASTAGMSDLIEEGGAAPGAPPAGFRLNGHDMAFVPGHEEEGAAVSDRLYVVSQGGNQTFAFNVSAGEGGALELQPLADYLPMRLFGGKALVGAGTRLFYDYGESWIPLVRQQRPRYEPLATLFTPLDETGSVPLTPEELAGPPFHAFDGREPGCVWHRLMLDACIPPETEVLISSRAADDERELATTDWRPEPPLYERAGGSELPFVRELAGERYKTWELLFQQARGRFLQLKIELRGNGRTTPRLRALRAYYPRFSYLAHYLPGVYREEAQSASFLERFLANLEGFYTAIEDRIAAAQLLFDVRSAPPDALAWLAGWFGAALDPAWDDARRRLFIKHAARLFQMRGTVRGLQMALRLSLDDCPDDSIFDGGEGDGRGARAASIRVIEKYRTRRTPGVLLGDPTDQAGPSLAVEGGARWLPSQGGAVLHERYGRMLRETLGERRPRPFPVRYPGGRRLPHWRQFALGALGFVPSSVDDDRARWQQFLRRRYGGVAALNAAHHTSWRKLSRVALPDDAAPGDAHFDDWREFALKYAPAGVAIYRAWWQDFLARRYLSVRALNDAYGTRWPSFELVSLPDRLPPDGPRLLDWYQFEGVVLPMRSSAHRFTVLLPLPAAASFDTEEQRRRLELAGRIVRLEKPAHTVFDLKLYWALFRVGEARLGEDTLLDVGSRAPQLLPPMVLGQQYLAQSHLAPRHPQDVADRQTVGAVRL